MKIVNHILNLLILQWFWVRLEIRNETIIINYKQLSSHIVESGIASRGVGETKEIRTTYFAWFIPSLTKFGWNSKYKPKHKKRLFTHKKV